MQRVPLAADRVRRPGLRQQLVAQERRELAVGRLAAAAAAPAEVGAQRSPAAAPSAVARAAGEPGEEAVRADVVGALLHRRPRPAGAAATSPAGGRSAQRRDVAVERGRHARPAGSRSVAQSSAVSVGIRSNTSRIVLQRARRCCSGRTRRRPAARSCSAQLELLAQRGDGHLRRSSSTGSAVAASAASVSAAQLPTARPVRPGRQVGQLGRRGRDSRTRSRCSGSSAQDWRRGSGRPARPPAVGVRSSASCGQTLGPAADPAPCGRPARRYLDVKRTTPSEVDERHVEDQGRGHRRRARRRRDDAHHLAVHQGPADPAVPRRQPRVLRPRHRAPRRHRRPGHHRRGERDQEARRRRQVRDDHAGRGPRRRSSA